MNDVRQCDICGTSLADVGQLFIKNGVKFCPKHFQSEMLTEIDAVQVVVWMTASEADRLFGTTYGSIGNG